MYPDIALSLSEKEVKEGGHDNLIMFEDGKVVELSKYFIWAFAY